MSVRPGSGISARPSSGTKEKGARRDLQIKVSARPYHLLQGPKPDLVIGKSLGLGVGMWGRWERSPPWKPASPSSLSAGFNSGFGLKDTWLSSLPRLQVGNGGKRELLSPPAWPLPISFSESLWALLFTITRSTNLGSAHGSPCLSLCLSRSSPSSLLPGLSRGFQPCLSFWLLGRIWGGASQSESRSTPVPPSASLLHREQRVRLCDGRPDHGGGHWRGHQPSPAQPLPLPLSPQSGRQLHALVRACDPISFLTLHFSYSLAPHPQRPTSALVPAVLGPSCPQPSNLPSLPPLLVAPMGGLDIPQHTPL